jgi:tetratricopeptide (TPR) repeat protein
MQKGKYEMKVQLHDEHHQALDTWLNENASAATLVVLDAHLDVNWLPDAYISYVRQRQESKKISHLGGGDLLVRDLPYFDIQNFLYLAHRLGIISRLVWVTPELAPNRAPFHLNRYLHKMQRLDEREYHSFKTGEHSIKGQLYGIPLEICGLHQLENIRLDGDNLLLDIDLDYFAGYSGRQLIVSPGTVYRALQKYIERVDFITLSRSCSSGYLPFYYHNLGEHLSDLITGETSEDYPAKNLDLPRDFSDRGIIEYLKKRPALITDPLKLGNFFLVKEIRLTNGDIEDFFPGGRDDGAPARYLFLKGLLYQANRFPDHARAYLEEAVKIAAGAERFHYLKSLGLLLYRLDNRDRARELFSRLIETRDDPDIHLVLGMMEKENGRYEQGIQHLHRAIELRPVNPHAYLELSKIAALQDRPNDKARCFETFLKYNTIII